MKVAFLQECSLQSLQFWPPKQCIQCIQLIENAAFSCKGTLDNLNNLSSVHFPFWYFFCSLHRENMCHLFSQVFFSFSTLRTGLIFCKPHFSLGFNQVQGNTVTLFLFGCETAHLRNKLFFFLMLSKIPKFNLIWNIWLLYPSLTAFIIFVFLLRSTQGSRVFVKGETWASVSGRKGPFQLPLSDEGFGGGTGRAAAQ